MFIKEKIHKKAVMPWTLLSKKSANIISQHSVPFKNKQLFVAR